MQAWKEGLVCVMECGDSAWKRTKPNKRYILLTQDRSLEKWAEGRNLCHKQIKIKTSAYIEAGRKAANRTGTGRTEPDWPGNRRKWMEEIGKGLNRTASNQNIKIQFFKIHQFKFSKFNFSKCHVFTARLPFWSTQKRKVAATIISYKKYREILFQKVASGYLLHFVKDGS